VSEQRALFHKCRSLAPKMTTGIFYISVNVGIYRNLEQIEILIKCETRDLRES
jgi:hypothetical protein